MIKKMDDLLLAASILKDCGGDFYSSDAEYELYKYKEAGVTLVFYRHKTTAGHYHTRVMNQNSKNKIRARELIAKLYQESGNNCTFSCKNKP